MKNVFDGIEPMVLKSKISIPYSWWAGDTAGTFLKSIMENCEIKGTKCSSCGKVYVPPRKVCPVCFKEMDWVKVSSEGTLVSFTVVRRKFASMPKEPPVAYGLIKLDGSDTAMLHMLGDIDPSQIKIGMRFKAKFLEERKGSMRDIECFVPVA